MKISPEWNFHIVTELPGARQVRYIVIEKRRSLVYDRRVERPPAFKRCDWLVYRKLYPSRVWLRQIQANRDKGERKHETI